MKDQLRPGLEIRDMARPQVRENRIEENAAGGIWVPSADRVDEVFSFNTFGKLAKDKAVRIVPPAQEP